MEPAKNQPPPETSLHFLDYWRIIRIRKTVIISVFLLIAITATVVTFILPASYSSTARIEINSDVSDIPGIGGGCRRIPAPATTPISSRRNSRSCSRKRCWAG